MHDLLHLMYQDGHLSSTELTALRRTSRQLGENPVRILRSLNVATPSEIKELLQRYYGFSAATDKVIEELDDSLRALIPADIALHYCVLAIAEEKNELYVLIEDPTDKGTIKQLEFFLGKKIVPVIATVQQLSNGLCRLYGVEPGRLNLSGLLEASRGAVGISATHLRKEVMLIDDSQPLLDDEEFKRLKIKPRKPEPKASEPKNASPAQNAKNDSALVIDPAMAAAVNLLGMRLALARSRNEAAVMATDRLKDFGVQLSMLEENKLEISWSGNLIVVDLSNHAKDNEIPQTLKAVVKKIAQCPA
ncbi:MAG: hypothetical protein ACO3A4_13865 [Silvanigrellaceae bacterium]